MSSKRAKHRKTCFMCDEVKTTREHVPPDCLFPEIKDLSEGVDYKKNLITVPSCERHNLKTSNDDEYLMGVLALYWRNNQAGHNHSMTKVKRAIERSHRYHDLFFRQDKHSLIFWENELLVTYPVDIDRFNDVMKKIAYGIYFHHFGKRFIGDVDILPISPSPIYREINEIVVSLHRTGQMMRLFCILQPRHGDNPDIFYYQIISDDPPESAIIRMLFYSGSEIIASLNTRRI